MDDIIFAEPLDEEYPEADLEGAVPIVFADGEEVFAEPADDEYVEADDVEQDDAEFDEDGRLLLRAPLKSMPRPEPTRMRPPGDQTPPPPRYGEKPVVPPAPAPRRLVPPPPPVRRT